MNSWMSVRRKGVLLLSVYSLGQRRKKKAMIIMSAVAQKEASEARKVMQRMT